MDYIFLSISLDLVLISQVCLPLTSLVQENTIMQIKQLNRITKIHF